MLRERPSSPVTLHPAAESAVVRFGPFQFDRGNQLLSRDGEEVTLPPRVLAVLDFLLARRGRVVSKQALLDGAWSGAHVAESSLTEAISLLRQALGDDAQSPTYVQTVHRRGYRFIAEVAVEPPARPAEIPPPAAQPSSSRPAETGSDEAQRPRVLGWLTAGALLGLALALAGWQLAPAVGGGASPGPTAPPRPQARFTLPLAEGQALRWWVPSLALSPDGRELVYLAEEDGVTRLHRRPLDRLEPTPIPGTDGAQTPFFSADGKQIAFFVEGELRAVALAGGPPVVLARAAKPMGGTWLADGSIVFSAGPPGGLRRLPADGGEPTVVTVPATATGEVSHAWPQALPGGRRVLFTVWANTLHTARAAVVDLETGEVTTVVDGAAGARYSPTGHLVWARPDGIVAAPFDLERLAPTGPPQVALAGVAVHPFTGLVQLALGPAGLAVTIPGRADAIGQRTLMRLSPDGAEDELPAPPRFYRNLAPAPGGDRLAATILDGDRSDVWVVHLADGALARLTYDGFNIEPVWSPDGRWVYFASNREGSYDVWRKPADGNGPVELVVGGPQHQYPNALTPDGAWLVYDQQDEHNGYDVWLRPLTDEGPDQAVLVGPENTFAGPLSPDGRHLAYMREEGGSWHVFVQAFPSGTARWQLSETGGVEPFWAPSGDRLYYLDEDGLLAVDVTFDPSFRASRPHRILASDAIAKAVALGPDLVYVRERASPDMPRALHVTLGWPGLAGLGSGP